MPTAFVHLPDHAHYRQDAFINGFARMGFIVRKTQPTQPLDPRDVAVIWNKTARSRQTIEAAKKGGGAVIVAENAYYGVDRNGHHQYALALDGHNGSGRWYAPDESRLEALQIDFKPLRAHTAPRVLIAAQRGIGSVLMRSPHFFERDTIDLLLRQGYLPRVRPHPGRHKPEIALSDDLALTDSLVVWSSNCASAALIEGIPTYYAAPTIACAGAALPIAQLHESAVGFSEAGRRRAFARMAWAQWSLDEVSSGEAMRTLMDVHAGKLPACQQGFGL